MSRGDRVSASGILSHSMRDNYNEHDVGEYYKKVGSSYRNPHFPGIRFCLYAWLNKWWKLSMGDNKAREMLFFDMACGSGEATAVFIEWCTAGKRAHEALENKAAGQEITGAPTPIRRRTQVEIPVLDSRFPDPRIIAADPYTSAAFVERTGLPCSSLSFHDVSEGLIPDIPTRIFSTQPIVEEEPEVSDSIDGPKIEMVVCSFALHLVESPSELFSLLWELSTKTRWLVVLAPHKKPEIKEGWGWLKWNVENWSETSMSDHNGELLHERVHCRVYRSVNF